MANLKLICFLLVVLYVGAIYGTGIGDKWFRIAYQSDLFGVRHSKLWH